MVQSGTHVTMADFLEEVPTWRHGPWFQRLAYFVLTKFQKRLSIVTERKGDGLYLVRVKLIQVKYQGTFKEKVVEKTLFGAYLHRFYRGDDDAALHDHQWPSISIVLSGGYWERQKFCQIWRRPGSIKFRGRRSFHQVQLDPVKSRGKPVWTLFIVGPHASDKSWGFISHGTRLWVRWCIYLGLTKEQVGDDSC